MTIRDAAVARSRARGEASRSSVTFMLAPLRFGVFYSAFYFHFKFLLTSFRLSFGRLFKFYLFYPFLS